MTMMMFRELTERRKKLFGRTHRSLSPADSIPSARTAMGKGCGGHGGLNILPHKSWHVWNFEARERVQRDEEAAQAEEQAATRTRHDAGRRHRHEELLARAGVSVARRSGGEGGDGVGGEEAPKRSAQGKKAQPPVDTTDERFRLGYNAGGRRGDPVPWYSRPSTSLYDHGREHSTSLPARVRRSNAEEEALRRGGEHGTVPAHQLLRGSDQAAQPPKPAAKAKPSWDDLRAERLAREAAEQKRQAAVMPGDGGRRGALRPGAGEEEPKLGGRYHGAFGNAPPAKHQRRT
jgi:hypothetical protein